MLTDSRDVKLVGGFLGRLAAPIADTDNLSARLRLEVWNMTAASVRTRADNVDANRGRSRHVFPRMK
jgi:hypothetical protein